VRRRHAGREDRDVCKAKVRPPAQYYITRMIPADQRPIPLSPQGAWDDGLRIDNVGRATSSKWSDGGPDRVWILGDPDHCDLDRVFDGRRQAVARQFLSVRVERDDRTR
jgi:hypothetical protein